MSSFGRIARGAEAGAIAAGGVAASFFIFDLVTLEPLSTPGILSGVVHPGSASIDLSSLSGIIGSLAMAWDLASFTALHFAALAAVGVLAALLFDWSRPSGLWRALSLVGLCAAAFFGLVAWSGGMLALGAVGWLPLAAIVLIAAFLIALVLRAGQMPDTDTGEASAG